MTWQTLVVLISAVGTVLAVVVSWRTAKSSAKAAEASAKKSAVEAQAIIIAGLRGEYERLSSENVTLHAQVVDLRQGYDDLHREHLALTELYEDVLHWAKIRGYHRPASW